jgi:hypothetical protein
VTGIITGMNRMTGTKGMTEMKRTTGMTRITGIIRMTMIRTTTATGTTRMLQVIGKPESETKVPQESIPESVFVNLIRSP